MKNKSVRVILSMLLNICIVTVGVFIIYAAGSRAYTFGHNIFDEEAIDTTENARQVEITISDNISAKQLSSMLYQKGLCKDKTIMYFQIMLSDYNKKFVGGTYTLNSGMKPSDMFKVMCTDKGEDNWVMIVEPRVVAYINSLDSGNSDICNLIEKEA